MHSKQTKQLLDQNELKDLFPDEWKPALNAYLLDRIREPYEALSGNIGSKEALRHVGEIVSSLLTNPPALQTLMRDIGSHINKNSDPVKVLKLFNEARVISENYSNPETVHDRWIESGMLSRSKQGFFQNIIGQIRVRLFEKVELTKNLRDEDVPAGNYTNNSFPEAVSQGKVLTAIDLQASTLTAIPRERDLE